MRRFKNLSRLAALVLLPIAAACTENIESGAVCPDLCPTENVPVKDTVLDAVSLDSVLGGYPTPGEPTVLLLSSHPRPDTLDVRLITRFDSLPAKYFPSGGADSVAIAGVDSAYLVLHVDTTQTRFNGGPATIEAFDVDTAAAVDTSTAALTKLFRADRFLGSVVYDSTTRTADSVRVRIDKTKLLAKITGAQRLRVGFRITSATGVVLRVRSSHGGVSSSGPRLSFDPVSATDSTYSPLLVTESSSTPNEPTTALGLRDFTIVSAGAVAAQASDLIIGGLPGRRSFLRFNVPKSLVDSSTIVRAVLLLNQRPVPGADRTDTVQIETDIVVAESIITDLRRASDLSAPGSSFGVDSLRLSPADSGQRSIGIVNLVRVWRGLPSTTQRALVLRSLLEGSQAGAIRFSSSEAAAALRPKLRISYIPRTEFALP